MNESFGVRSFVNCKHIERHFSNVSGICFLVHKQLSQASPDFDSSDATWILTSSFIIFTMQSGFGLLEAGKVFCDSYWSMSHLHFIVDLPLVWYFHHLHTQITCIRFRTLFGLDNFQHCSKNCCLHLRQTTLGGTKEHAPKWKSASILLQSDQLCCRALAYCSKFWPHVEIKDQVCNYRGA